MGKNQIAIVGITKSVGKGDLIVVCEVHTEYALCGIYDRHIGTIGLDSPDHEPLLFDENAVKLFGKIIGYCDRSEIIDHEINVKLI